MKKGNKGVATLLMSLVEVVIGILLLIDPAGFTSGILIAFGIVMMLVGIVDIIRYFATKAEEAAQKGLLASGILFAAIGGFCAFHSEWLVATFPVITVFYGILILVSGVGKLQMSVDMVRLKQKYWFIALIGALLTLLIAVLVICNPFSTTAILWTFLGISLIVEAVADIVAFIFSRKS